MTDPRSTRSRTAILTAARALLLKEGPAAVTHQRVAQEAGIGRATVYRHWAQPEQLLLAAMSGSDLPYFRDPTPPVRPWLRDQLRAMATEMALPEVVAVTLTLMQGAVWSPQIADQRNHAIAAITDRLRAALEIAATTGELTADVSPDDAASLLIGPLVYRTAMQAGTVPDALIDRLLDGIGLSR
ncbi:TetR/AcrR family transcriptional regulator [Umezawaea endophytica]|uniref:TetR/AcrR family transcriptional regulator n=1 Tax=Umezawaea endophytica TaxID=1654476 RepID=A0A9X2VUT1_9PSEU|nr:TetR/AcrR family transcriptional regulator [Umezawaea endophytica]MCS7483034.1 TetR/AcrR family transcriptional regulator [Umezawaea endophytica]